MSMFDEMVLPANKSRFLEWEQARMLLRHEDIAPLQEYITSESFDADAEALARGDLWFGIPTKKMIRKWNTTRLRIVYVFPDRERYFMRYLSFMLHKYDDRFSPNLYSYCKGRSVTRALKQTREQFDFGKDYVFKLDIASYGISIDPDLLVSALGEIIDDDDALLAFFEKLLLRKQSYRNGQLVSESTGSLPGMSAHSFLLNVYLHRIDCDFQDKAKLYFRYTDDVFLVAPSLEEITRLSDEYKQRISALNLRINEEKTAILDPSQDWTFLGFHFFPNGAIDISPVTVAKMKKKIRHRGRVWRREVVQQKVSTEEAIRGFLSRMNRVFFGGADGRRVDYASRYFPIITVDDSLAELDRYVQMYARYIVTGRFTKKNYNLRYHELKSLGFRSLVRAYHSTRE